ncbi:MAG: hypothetical protein KJO76_00845 [Gammaproteobacteria bacterium]|nr:hypothetical protein [Gammaproteobacteria bacterium]
MSLLGIEGILVERVAHNLPPAAVWKYTSHHDPSLEMGTDFTSAAR